MKQIKIHVLVFAMAVTLAGCGGAFKDNTYKSLVAAHETYQASKAATQSAYDNGLISDDTAEEINTYAKTFAQSYNNATTDFKDWDRAGQPESGSGAVQAAISAAWDQWLVLKQLLKDKGIL